METLKNGTFIISLDFELHWGVFDVKGIEQYKENLDNTRKAIKKIVSLSNKYGIRLTFSTVGFLFAKNKEQLKLYMPKKLPSYTNQKFNPYLLFDIIGENEKEDPYHYAYNTIKQLAKDNRHEIGTHTFSHYYCQANGQTINEFEADIISAKEIGESLNIPITSIVFPRNQVNDDYLKICSNYGITSYRGTEKAFIYSLKKGGKLQLVPLIIIKGLRLLDSYINIFGNKTYKISKIKNEKFDCVNLPSSSFLRPYNNKLKIFEYLKLQRIKKAMTYAAKNNELYHLWWHPHNFGTNLDKNLEILENIFVHYNKLNATFNFCSDTMSTCRAKIKSEN